MLCRAGVRIRQAAKGKIHVAFLHETERLLIVALHELKLHRREPAGEGPKDPGKDLRAAAGRSRHPQAGHLAAAQIRQRRCRALLYRQHPAGAVQIDLPCGGQGDAFAAAEDQPGAQLLFQIVQPAAKPRLRHPQPPGRPGKGTLLRQRDDILL